MTKHILGVDKGGNLWRMGRVDPNTGEIIGRVVVCNLSKITSDEEQNKVVLDEVQRFSQLEQTLGIGICAAGIMMKKI